MRIFLVFCIALTGCTSVDERQAHQQNQIKMIQVQKDAEFQTKAAEANAKAELYRALAVVAQTNPEQASAVTVALAVQGLGGEADGGASGIVPLQPLQNEGLEYAKVFAGPAMNLVSGLGVAYINADVAKTQSDNAAAVQINDALQDSAIVNAVAGLGTAAANATGLMVNGNYYSVTDEGTIDQSSTVTTTQTTTAITDSYNNTDNSDNSIVDYSSVTYGGQEFSLPDLINYLTGTGLAYNLTIGDTVYTIDGDGEAVVVDCSGVDFSPPRLECI